MSKTVISFQLRESLRRRYPNAHVELMDASVDAWEPGKLLPVYKQFVWQMRLIGLTYWLRDKLDCDDWAWLFRAYVIVRNALGRGDNARAIGLICYLQEGDPSQPHSVNAAIIADGQGYRITEIEPQPNGGLYTLTRQEMDSVWFALF